MLPPFRSQIAAAEVVVNELDGRFNARIYPIDKVF
jgi:hypothetical protein